MKIRRRQLLHLAAGAAALPAMSLIARAQNYPTRPVHLITGFAAGDPNDTTARLIGRWLSERLRQHFVIQNRTGAGGKVAGLSSDLLLSVSQRVDVDTTANTFA